MKLKMFKDMSLEEKTSLLKAEDKKELIEIYNTYLGKWKPNYSKSWYGNFIYRVVPKKPTINWDYILDEYNYLARDSNGYWHVYEYKPVCLSNTWCPQRGKYSRVIPEILEPFDKGSCDWTDSLIKRPVYEDNEPMSNPGDRDYTC